MRNFMLTATNQPAWSFWQKKHAGAKNERGNDSEAEHPSPALDTSKSVIGQIRNHDADGNGELKERYDPAAHMRRRNFRQIDWDIC